MDPAPLISSFVSLVGMLALFKQERGTTENLDHRKFMEWLDHHQHQELKDLISRTHHLSSEVDQLLLQDQREILRRFSALDTVLSSVLSRLEDFAGIATVLRPSAQISSQAIDILRLLAESDANGFSILPLVGQKLLCLNSGQTYAVEEERFLPDDLAQLVACGLLLEDFTSRGETLYRLTRAGAEYAKQAPRENEQAPADPPLSEA